MAVIEVFADVSCPFTHVGLRRLVERRARLGRGEVRFAVRAWPLELVNGTPMDPDAVADKIEQIRSQVAPDLFTGFRPDRFPTTTLPALRLTHAASAVDVGLGETVALELRDRLFERGHDVGDPDVLTEVAESHGLAPVSMSTELSADDPVRADWDEGRARGVIGSPHFFVDGFDMFCPSLAITKAGARLSIEFDVDRFETFTTACFS